MAAIITITFSPVIDKSAWVDKLVPEKKLRCTSLKLEPGGGGINVARAIKKLGGEAMAIYPSGGHVGQFFDELMEAEGIPVTRIDAENETRENLIIHERSSNHQYRFGMPATELNENEWRQILKIIDQANNIDFIVASGSLPAGVPQDIFARIARISRKKNAKFIVDTSGGALIDAVRETVYLIKPNLGELSTLAGKRYLEPNEIVGAAKQVIASGECEVLVVSMGAEGAMLVTENIDKKIVAPPVHRKSTVGAGDSMLAGIVLQLSRGKNLEESVQFGVACGSAATLNEGTELCRLEDVEKLYKAITTKEIDPQRSRLS